MGAAVLFAMATAAWAGPVLDRVKQRQTLACGVIAVPEDYTKSDVHGTLDDFGSDLCRAVAAAVVGVNAKMAVRSFPDERHGFEAIAAGKVDLLLRGLAIRFRGDHPRAKVRTPGILRCRGSPGAAQ